MGLNRGLPDYWRTLKPLCQWPGSLEIRQKPPKFVDQFIYHGNNISSTERDVNILEGKAYTAIDKLITL